MYLATLRNLATVGCTETCRAVNQIKTLGVHAIKNYKKKLFYFYVETRIGAGGFTEDLINGYGTYATADLGTALLYRYKEHVLMHFIRGR